MKEARIEVKDSITMNRGTFLLNIQNRQNSTWQGSVTWVEKQNKQHFRGALELIKLIESALDEDEQEGGRYET